MLKHEVKEEDQNEMETHVAVEGVDNETYLHEGGMMEDQSLHQEMIEEEVEEHQISMEQNEEEEEEAAHKILGLQTGATEDDDIYMSTDHVGHGDVEMGSESHDTVTSDVSKADANSRSVYVGNVDYQVTVEELRDHFAACGNISRVTIMMNKQTGAPMGYGFIEFHKTEGATNALMLDETELRERIIKVQIKRKNLPGMGRCSNRGGRGGSFFGGNTSAVGNMTEAFQSMMMNPMMMSMMSMFNQTMSGGLRGAHRGRGRGGALGGSASNSRGRGVHGYNSNTLSGNNSAGGSGISSGSNLGNSGDLKRNLKR